MNLIVEEISGYYREYNEGISELLEGPASSFGEPVKKALGLGTVKSSALHGQLFEKIKAAVEKLNEELKAESDEKTAAEALEVMLFYDRNVMDESILLGFRAAESLAAPLVEHLSTDTACSILARYSTLNNPKEMMPKQYELYKALSLKADTGIKEKKFLLKGKGELKKRKSIFGNKNK